MGDFIEVKYQCQLMSDLPADQLQTSPPTSSLKHLDHGAL